MQSGKDDDDIKYFKLLQQKEITYFIITAVMYLLCIYPREHFCAAQYKMHCAKS